MVKKFLDSTGLSTLWNRILGIVEAVDEVKADKPTLESGQTGTIEEYVSERLENSGSTLPETLDIVCGNSTTNI